MLSGGCDDDVEVEVLPAEAVDVKDDGNLQEETSDMNHEEELSPSSSSSSRWQNMSSKKKLAIGLISLALVAVVTLSVGLTVGNKKNENQQTTVAQSKQSLANCLAQPEYADYSIIEKEATATATDDDGVTTTTITDSPTPFLSTPSPSPSSDDDDDFDADPLLVYTDDRMGGEILTFDDDSGRKKRELQEEKEGVSYSGNMKDGNALQLRSRQSSSRLSKSMEERVRKRIDYVYIHMAYIIYSYIHPAKLSSLVQQYTNLKI